MKTTFLSFLLLAITAAGFSQKVSYGISMGLNYSDFQLEQDLSLNNQIEALRSEGRPGFYLGIHSLINVASRVKLSPQLLLSFTENIFEIEYDSDITNSLRMENVFIQVPIDLQLELLRGSNALYLIGGVEYSFSVLEEKEELVDIKKSFWSARIGLGFRKDFKSFSASPEITFAKSFSSIEENNTLVINQVLTNLDHTNLGLSIKFQGLLDQN